MYVSLIILEQNNWFIILKLIYVTKKKLYKLNDMKYSPRK